MAQPVETATDHRHTHKYLGLIMVNKLANIRTDRRTLPNVLSPLASRSIMIPQGLYGAYWHEGTRLEKWKQMQSNEEDWRNKKLKEIVCNVG